MISTESSTWNLGYFRNWLPFGKSISSIHASKASYGGQNLRRQESLGIFLAFAISNEKPHPSTPSNLFIWCGIPWRIPPRYTLLTCIYCHHSIWLYMHYTYINRYMDTQIHGYINPSTPPTHPSIHSSIHLSIHEYTHTYKGLITFDKGPAWSYGWHRLGR